MGNGTPKLSLQNGFTDHANAAEKLHELTLRLKDCSDNGKPEEKEVGALKTTRNILDLDRKMSAIYIQTGAQSTSRNPRATQSVDYNHKMDKKILNII